MADDAFITPFMEDYFAECEEHLVEIRRLLVAIARQPSHGDSTAIVGDLFRSFHSIKGISGMVEMREAESLAHQMESYLRAVRQGETTVHSAGVDALIAGTDALERTIAARRSDQPIPNCEAVLAQIARAISGPPAAADAPVQPARTDDARPHWLVTFTPSAALAARGVTVDSVRQRIRTAAEIIDAKPRVLPGGIAFDFTVAGALDDETLHTWRADGLTVEPLAVEAAPQEPVVEGGSDPSGRLALAHVVRVDLARLDELMHMIGNLVISRARLSSALARVERHVPPREWRTVQENAQIIERQLRDLREGVMRVRLVKVGEIFRRMPLAVRDLAREMGKDVRLEIRGQETEIDKFVIERMMDPVLHLVRNAVSHGLETPDQRQAAGKPREGTLTLSAAAVGDSVVLEIIDDGRGVDVAAVAARARRAGLLAEDATLDAADVLDVICAPGFSTREETDRASGRGVGMAVVKSTVEDLNGTLSLESTPGEGTRFVIELPVTLSIADALIAHVGDRRFAVPQASVREIIEVAADTFRAIERHEIVPYRGGSLPVVRLATQFGLGSAPRPTFHVLVAGSGPDAVGIVVDRVASQQEIVVRSIQDTLVRVPGVTGATDLGDGRVVLILDLGALARAARVTAAAGLETT